MATILDLFVGCGGLTLGAERAGFRTVAAVDSDPILTSSLARNFPRTQLVHADVGSLDEAALREMLPGGADGVIGGPPCQAFSEIGRRAPDDARRSLVWHFFRIVALVRPAFFLMENVRGLAFPKNRPVLDAALGQLGGRWEIIGPILLDAADFGAATNRRRLFVFGFDRERADVPLITELAGGTPTRTTVREAITDLEDAAEIGVTQDGFDRWQYGPHRVMSRYAARMRSGSGIFTGHRRTLHEEATVTRFATVPQGALERIGRYRRLSWNGFCPALRAGTGNDRGSYQAVRPLHPTENRVITPREAARLQGFPDDFVFHLTVWHSFRMIGNSVSPIIAESLLAAVLPRVETSSFATIAAQ